MTGSALVAAGCRACSAPIEPGAVRCARCGAPQSDSITCPHCSAVANTSPDPELGFRCDVCGGPRVPVLDPNEKRAGRETPHLRRAESARRARAKARALAVTGGVAAASFLLFGAVLAMLGTSFGVLLMGALAAASGFLVVSSLGRAKASTAALGPALDAAWQAAAADVIERAPGPVTARALAAKLGVDEARAEELLAYLEVSDLVRGDARGYSPRLRIETSDDMAAEAEALADIEAAEAARGRTQR